jgi:diamine N-acetyltransferase
MGRSQPEFEAGRQPIFAIVGEQVALGPYTRDILPAWSRWANDFAVRVLAGDPLYPNSPESTEGLYDRLCGERAMDRARFIIYERTTLRPIGMTHLTDIDYAARTASYSIIIGEKDCWGKGYGTETTILMLDYGFTALGLHNIMLCAYAFNARGLRAYARAGFKEVGRRREAHRLGDRVSDVVYMDCLSTEFTSPLQPVIELPRQG